MMRKAIRAGVGWVWLARLANCTLLSNLKYLESDVMYKINAVESRTLFLVYFILKEHRHKGRKNIAYSREHENIQKQVHTQYLYTYTYTKTAATACALHNKYI